MIGTSLAHYRVTAKIGEGGMGEVWRATDSKLDREVALKVLPEKFAHDPERMARFEREAKALASLNHPNIATLFGLETAIPSGTDSDADSDAGLSPEPQASSPTTFLVMELLEGESLRERLSDGALPYRKAAEIGAAIARGLGAAHERGIVHRDIKPENVFLTNDGQVRVLDFGLATDHAYGISDGGNTETPTVTRRTDPGTVLGTVGYMAPEQVRGDQADSRTDIFSLGAVLYEMLTGQQAFRRETAPETMTAILREEPPEAADSGIVVPGAVDRLVRRCLEKRPEERFQSARDLAVDLETLATGSGMPSGAEERPIAVRSQRRVWLPMAGVAAVVGAILGVLAAGWLFDRATGDELRIQKLTFRRGMVWSARFAPEAGSIVYGAAWEGEPPELFMTRIDDVDSRPLDLGAADVLAISEGGDMALSLGRRFTVGWETSGTLATSSLVGLAPREVLEGVSVADWGPDGKSLAVVREIAGRYRLEYPIGEILYETDGWLGSVRVRPGGDMVAFVEHPTRGDNAGWVTVVDLGGRLRILDDSGVQRGLAWTPSGDEVWGASGGTLIALNMSGERRTVYAGTDTMWLQDISKDGRVLVSAATIRREMIGRAPGDTVERNLSWFDWSAPQALSADGETVIFDEQNIVSENGYRVYIRGTDGSPPVGIGRGTGRAQSPDGRWALTVSRPFRDPRWVLLPTGPGEARELPEGLIRSKLWAHWMPDGNRLIVAGTEPGGVLSLYVRGLDPAEERLLTPDGIDYVYTGYPVSPDGAWVAAKPIGGTPMLYPVDGGEARVIPGLEDSETPVQWTEDGKALYVYQSGELPARVSLVNVDDGKRLPWRDLAPSDTAGVSGIDYLAVTPDGTGYVYSYRRLLSDLYVFEGLR
jgi:Tol biopolymer transport system component